MPSVETFRVIAVIPVRGGSIGIPRKNARLLAGRPLLAYSIEAARAAQHIADVVVSTEDEELTAIAMRFGARVVPREIGLADGRTTLDEVIAHAAIDLDCTHIVTIQATSPLLRPRTIDRAIERLTAGVDTVLTAVEDRHLSWGLDAQGQLRANCATRVNRQELPLEYRETGAVVVCSRQQALTGTRFGRSVAIIEVSKEEAIDIDDRFDWWLAEKSLERKRIVFVITGSRQVGLGHAYRGLTLADRLIDHEIIFLASPADELAVSLIRSRFYRCEVVSDALQTLQELNADLIINDCLDTTAAYMSKLVERGYLVLNFEDQGPGQPFARLTINALHADTDTGEGTSVASSHKVPGSTLNGPSYAVLRDEFYTATPIEVREDVSNVLILFGGTDPNDLSPRCLRWVDSLEGDWTITLILGLGYPEPEKIREAAAQCQHRVTVIKNTRVISREMMRADIAITSAGRTVFELASVGVPMIVIPQNQREMMHALARGGPGILATAPAATLNQSELCAGVATLLGDADLRRKMHRELLSLDVRRGVDRILELIHSLLRNVPKVERSEHA